MCVHSPCKLGGILQGRPEGTNKFRVVVEDPPSRQNLVYTGAAILADIYADFEEEWITRADYSEDPARAWQKCSGALGVGAS
jgi:actin-related protein 2